MIIPANIIYAIIGSIGVFNHCHLVACPNTITTLLLQVMITLRDWSFNVVFRDHYSLISLMFFQVASPESSNIAELYVNPATLSDC